MDNNLELRVRALEEKQREYERAISLEAGRIILQRPSIVRGALNVNGITIFTGNGSPENVIAANVGSMYLRLNGGSGSVLYVKESGTGRTGWSTTA